MDIEPVQGELETLPIPEKPGQTLYRVISKTPPHNNLASLMCRVGSDTPVIITSTTGANNGFGEPNSKYWHNLYIQNVDAPALSPEGQEIVLDNKFREDFNEIDSTCTANYQLRANFKYKVWGVQFDGQCSTVLGTDVTIRVDTP